YLDARALDAGDLPRAGVDHLAAEAARRAPAQVHAQQHLCPVLGLGAAGPRLDVEKCVVRIHLAPEHALELEVAHPGLETPGVALDVLRRARIALGLGELEQLGRLADAAAGAVDRA